jgi:hypothetical protein
VTVTVPVRTPPPPVPSVPGGAHVPSRLPDLSYSRFAVPGYNLGCSLGADWVRCDVARSAWIPPIRPSSCTLDWAQGIELGPSGRSRFVCAGNSMIDPSGPVVPDGRDDRVGEVVCQVRLRWVTCFMPDGHGFSLGRTGYSIF